MRRLARLALIIAAVFAAASSASAQESQAAKTTRKRLQQVVDIDMKEIGTKVFFDDVEREMEPSVKFRIDNGSGVSNNTKISYKGKATVEKILNELADKNDWGWYVVSDAGNNKVDGKVMIRKSSKGKERGYEAGKEPKKSTSLDPVPRSRAPRADAHLEVPRPEAARAESFVGIAYLRRFQL